MLDRSLRLAAAAIFAGAVSNPALACERLTEGPSARVVEVTDGDTVVLDNSEHVRLIGTQAPKLPLGREGFQAWPLAEDSRRALSGLLLDQEVQLRFGGERRDRHGRTLAHLFLADGDQMWAQREMVRSGLARVYSFPDNRYCLGELLAAEAEARVERRGIWRDPFYAIRNAGQPEVLLKQEGHYELVEGRVLLADRAGSTIYLNFGRHWKTDFTVVMARQAQVLFTEIGLDPLALEGQLIRVRGWIETEDGPRIEVTHPEQIEVLATP